MDWSRILEKLKEPLVIEALVAVGLFVAVLLVFRRVRRVAEELERRKALHEYVRGLDEYLRGDFREAIATLEKVLERDPENVEARIALGDCYRETGDPAEAKKHHHHVHKVFGHELTRNFLSLGRDELALKGYDRAVEAFGRALELTPGDADALAGLARAYAEGGNPVEAAECLRRLYPKGPGAGMNAKEKRDAARRFAEAGSARLSERDPEGAVRHFAEALAFQPSDVRARTGLVRAAQELGDADKARRIVEEHVAELKRLAADEAVLFEPAAPRPAEPVVADAGETSAEQAARYLPAKTGEVGAIVAAVEDKTARYACDQCGALLRDHGAECPYCRGVGTVGPLEELSALYLAPVPDFAAKVDEVEEGAAFVQALGHRASLGDDEARERLLAMGPGMLYHLFGALPALEARRALGAQVAALGSAVAREVRQCHAARSVGIGAGAKPHDDFAAAFYLALPPEDAAAFLPSLGEARDAAVAGCLSDPRLPEAVRDAATKDLAARGAAALVALTEAVAASGDPGAVERAAGLLREWGPATLEEVDRRYFQATLLGRLFKGRSGVRRRALADVLARTGLPGARELLQRAAAQEKDDALRRHYLQALERAGGPAA